MANIKQCASQAIVCVGGNTQETATLIPHTSDRKMITKDQQSASKPTQTPILDFTADLIYMLGNISALTNTKWYLGILFNDTSNLWLQIAEVGEAVLGKYLVRLQAGNEPNLYADHRHRLQTYGPFNYFGEFGTIVQAIGGDSNIPVKNNLIGPSVATGAWTPEMVWDMGFIPAYMNSLSTLSVEQ